MGLMIMGIVFFVIMFGVAFRAHHRIGESFITVFSMFMGVVGTAAFIIALCAGSVDYFYRDVAIAKETAHRTTLERMLYESYDPSNLRSALEFNEEQKIASAQNQTFLMRCWTKCLTVDTIAIPRKGYMPYQGIQVQVVP